jgi:hypothetical protein
MHRSTSWTVTASGAVLAALLSGCSSGGGDAGQAGGSTPSGAAAASSSPSPSPAAATPSGPPPAPGRVVFTDEMDDDRNGWGTGGGTTFAGGEYVQAASVPVGLAGFPDALMPSAPPAVIVTGRMSAPTSSTILAVTCNNVPDGQGGGKFYALGIGSDVMFISRTSSHDATPLQGDVLATTDTGTDLTVPHDVQASCVPAGAEMDLWLSIDGRPVLSAVDADPIAAGPPGLQIVGRDAAGSSYEGHVASFSVAIPA